MQKIFNINIGINISKRQISISISISIFRNCIFQYQYQYQYDQYIGFSIFFNILSHPCSSLFYQIQFDLDYPQLFNLWLMPNSVRFWPCQENRLTIRKIVIPPSFLQELLKSCKVCNWEKTFPFDFLPCQIYC